MFCSPSSTNQVSYNELPSMRHISHQHWLAATLYRLMFPLSPSAKRREGSSWLKGQMLGQQRLRIQPNNRDLKWTTSVFPIPSVSSKSTWAQMRKREVLSWKEHLHPRTKYPSLQTTKEKAKGNCHLPARYKHLLLLASSKSGDFPNKRNCYSEHNCSL